MEFKQIDNYLRNTERGTFIAINNLVGFYVSHEVVDEKTILVNPSYESEIDEEDRFREFLERDLLQVKVPSLPRYEPQRIGDIWCAVPLHAKLEYQLSESIVEIAQQLQGNGEKEFDFNYISFITQLKVEGEPARKRDLEINEVSMNGRAYEIYSPKHMAQWFEKRDENRNS